jgi:pimeloyl-ACP methyl ester carboxylesterase
MSDSATKNTDTAASEVRPGWWVRLRPWIVPTFGSTSWKQRLRKIALRVVVYYSLIVVAMAVFQRELIYRPGRAEQIRATDSSLPSGTVHDVTVATEDGVLLNGWHILPAGLNCTTREDCDRELAETKWLVLFFHGNGGDRRGREFDSLSFTELDSHVFLFDYRGYGDNSGTPSEEGLAADARAVWKYATEERGVPAERIIVYAESLGGGVATRLIADLCKAGTPPAGLILGGTFSSMTDTASSHYPWLPVGLILLDRFESDRYVTSIDCPILQLHGRHDDIVPLAVGRKLFAATPQQSAGRIPKQFVEFKDAAHNDFDERRFQTAVGTFLGRIVRQDSERGAADTTGKPTNY